MDNIKCYLGKKLIRQELEYWLSLLLQVLKARFQGDADQGTTRILRICSLVPYYSILHLKKNGNNKNNKNSNTSNHNFSQRSTIRKTIRITKRITMRRTSRITKRRTIIMTIIVSIRITIIITLWIIIVLPMSNIDKTT